MSGALAFLVGMGGGYMQGQRQKKVDAEREEERKFRQEERDFVRGERARTAAMRKDVADAGAPVAVETPWQPAVDDEGNAMPEAPAMRVGTQRFATMGDAQQAADAANTPQAQAARLAGAYMRHGEVDKAASVRSSARQEELAGIQLDRTKKAAKREDALMEFGQAVARGGWSAVPQVYDRYEDGNSATVTEDGKGGATVTQLGKDGKPVGSKHYADLPTFLADAYAAFDPEKWIGMKREDARNKKADERDARDFGLRETVAKASMANDATRTRLAAAAEGRAARAADDDAKIPQAIKMQASSAAKRLESIGKAITDAMAQGSWDAKSAGAQQLMLEQRTVQTQLDNLLAPYVEAARGGKSAAAADPLDLMKAAPGAAVAQKDPPQRPHQAVEMAKPAPYIPPPGSRVAQMRQRNDQARAAQQQAAMRADTGATSASAAAALQAGDRRAAFAVQQMPGFGLLDMQTKLAIHALVNGQ